MYEQLIITKNEQKNNKNNKNRLNEVHIKIKKKVK